MDSTPPTLWAQLCVLPFLLGDVKYCSASTHMLIHPSSESDGESIDHQGKRGYLREFQGDGLQLDVAFKTGSVPRPQRLFAAVSPQKGRGADRLQDVVMIAALHALAHGLLRVTRTSLSFLVL